MKTNSIFSAISLLSSEIGHKKNGNKTDFSDYSRLVPEAGEISNFLKEDLAMILEF